MTDSLVSIEKKERRWLTLSFDVFGKGRSPCPEASSGTAANISKVRDIFTCCLLMANKVRRALRNIGQHTTSCTNDSSGWNNTHQKVIFKVVPIFGLPYSEKWLKMLLSLTKLLLLGLRDLFTFSSLR